jgi:hypothetical protein
MGAHRGPALGGGLRKAESRKTQIGHKNPQKQPEKKKGKLEKKKERKKNKESGGGEPGRG